MDNAGSNVHIGIIDSLRSPPPGYSLNIDIQNTESVIDSDRNETTTHGRGVFTASAALASEATYSLYQAATEDADIKPFDYANAIALAQEQDVDILNVSYGEFMPDCEGDCPFCYATERALEEDITVVAAAGNHERNKPSIFCPSLKEDTISVSGMIAQCTKEAKGIPDGAYRLPNLETPYEAEDRVYCGQKGCENGVNGICTHHLTERPWDGNPNSVGEKPDVLAPAHLILPDSNGGLKTETGTSYAAPLVTASLAIAYSKVAEDDLPFPNPYQARQSVRASGYRIRDTTTSKLDTYQLSLKLRERIDERSRNDST